MDIPVLFKRAYGVKPSTISRLLVNFSLSVSWGILFLIFLGLMAVVPIDSIIQLRNSVFVFNTFVIVIGCAIFVVVALVIYFSRLYEFRSALVDIPKHYMPITKQDLGAKCFNSIAENLLRTQTIVEKLGPIDIAAINHPGLSPPLYTHYNALGARVQSKQTLEFDDMVEDTLPPNLVYEDVLRTLGDKIKFGDHHFFNSDIAIPNHYSFQEIFYFLRDSYFPASRPNAKIMGLVEAVVERYEYLRFSGEPILLHRFVEFMELLITFVRYTSMAPNNGSSMYIANGGSTSEIPTPGIRVTRTSFQSNSSFNLNEFLSHPRGFVSGTMMDLDTIPKLFVGAQADEISPDAARHSRGDAQNKRPSFTRFRLSGGQSPFLGNLDVSKRRPSSVAVSFVSGESDLGSAFPSRVNLRHRLSNRSIRMEDVMAEDAAFQGGDVDSVYGFRDGGSAHGRRVGGNFYRRRSSSNSDSSIRHHSTRPLSSGPGPQVSLTGLLVWHHQGWRGEGDADGELVFKALTNTEEPQAYEPSRLYADDFFTGTDTEGAPLQSVVSDSYSFHSATPSFSRHSSPTRRRHRFRFRGAFNRSGSSDEDLVASVSPNRTDAAELMNRSLPLFKRLKEGA